MSGQKYSQLPLILVHVAGSAGRQIEARRDEGQKNADLLVVVDGDVEQLLQCPDVLQLVRVLATTLLDNGAQVLENTLSRVQNSLATSSDCDETVVSGLLNDLGAELRDLVLLLLFLGCLDNFLLLAHKVLLVLPVGVDVLLEVAVVLLDLLADSVETATVDSVHLLGSDLLLLVGLDDNRLEVGNGLDVQLGDLAIVLLGQSRHLADELVELCITRCQHCLSTPPPCSMPPPEPLRK